MSAPISTVRPKPDRVLADIADYVTTFRITSKEALATAFCFATDATGVLVQPTPLPDKKRQPCRRAHFFVQIADADHVFFEYTPFVFSLFAQVVTVVSTRKFCLVVPFDQQSFDVYRADASRDAALATHK